MSAFGRNDSIAGGDPSPAAFVDDPNWADFIPERRDAARSRHLPAHEDCAQVEVATAQGHLRAGGALGQMDGYEERPGQVDMAGAVAAAFNAREHLAIEAGTGVGKSLAYLVPSILWAWTNDTPVVVATATRNLQSQLVQSDIPRAVQVLGDDAAKFRVALLKGRTNYLCLRAVADFFASGYWTMAEDEQRMMPGFVRWLRHTADGDLDSYEGLPRAQLSCAGDECGGRHCAYYARCFVYKARKAAAEAHLVVANHALVLAEATAAGSGILPAYGRLVMDEAHNLESAATDYLSLEFSVPALTRILNRLSRRGRGRRGGGKAGVFAAVERQFGRGAFNGSSAGANVMRALAAAAKAMPRVVAAADALADVASRLLRPADGGDVCRYRAGVDGRREFALHGLFKPYEPGDWSEADAAAAHSGFEAALAEMVNRLHGLRDALDGAVPDGELNFFADLSTQVANAAESLVAFANATNFVLLGDRPTHSYWAERTHPARRPSHVRLVAAPLSVADDLRRFLYDVKDSVVLCSATLRVGGDFGYMARRLGLGERFRFMTASSPFDYFRQSLVLAADCLPDPSARAADYAAALAHVLGDIISVTHGRLLVLFTSIEMMKAVAAQAAGPMLESGLTLLVQGEGLSREAMTQRLRRSSNVVLFGAQSFWEGVDVAGDALSCVVLARLPFAQVGDPVVEARAEKVERDGGSAFRDYSLPEAVIRFRQGFGRLIRTKSDRGVVVVADPRLVTKNYGALFRKSIPATVHVVSCAGDLVGRMSDFFADTPLP